MHSCTRCPQEPTLKWSGYLNGAHLYRCPSCFEHSSPPAPLAARWEPVEDDADEPVQCAACDCLILLTHKNHDYWCPGCLTATDEEGHPLLEEECGKCGCELHTTKGEFGADHGYPAWRFVAGAVAQLLHLDDGYMVCGDCLQDRQQDFEDDLTEAKDLLNEDDDAEDVVACLDVETTHESESEVSS